jgi:4-carboxymuconolactone decarboxylase
MSSPKDRMPPLSARKMTAAQKQAAQAVIQGPRGALIGPFIPALRSPEFMLRLQSLGEYLRYHSALGPRLGELVIILTARLWTQHFEWHVHAPLAKKHGLKREVIDAIAEGRRPVHMKHDEALVFDFFMELAHNRSVSDATYAHAANLFGDQGVIDLIGAVGYYSTLAMIMNVARTPSPERVLQPFPA